MFPSPFQSKASARAVVRLVLGAALMLAAAPAWASDHGTMEHKPGIRDALSTPLEDLNLKSADIPDVLARAVASPYDVDGLDSCEAVAAEIGRLDAALGPDLDEAPAPDHRPLARRLGSQAHDAAVGAVHDKAGGLFPFRSWIRVLTGADQHQKKIDKAVRSGGIRRGYLKGLGMRMNCAPPAAPSWFKPVRHKAETGGGFHLDWRDLWDRLVAWWRSWWPF